MKKIALLMIFVILVSLSSVCFAYDDQSSIYRTEIVVKIGDENILINGETVKNDAAAKIVNDRTMVPIRIIAEALGSTVTYNPYPYPYPTVTITNERIHCNAEISIGDTEVKLWREPFYSYDEYFISKNSSLDTPAFIENGRTYLPLRFVADFLGADVYWDGETKTVKIWGNAYSQNVYYEDTTIPDFTNYLKDVPYIFGKGYCAYSYDYRDNIVIILTDYFDELENLGFEIQSKTDENGACEYILSDGVSILDFIYDYSLRHIEIIYDDRF